MSEWWTYTLSDFLMFSPRTYYRMLGRYNEGVWPAHVVTLGLGLAMLGLLRRPGGAPLRGATGLLAALWAWLAWGFFRDRYAEINLAARWLALLFGGQALLLAWLGALRGRLRVPPRRDVVGWLGIGLFAGALLLYPALAPMLGRGWRQSEVFGIAPDPTAIGTLGLLLLTEGRGRPALLAIPLFWCLLGSATLWALGSPEAWVLGAAGIVALAATLARARIAR